MSDATQEQVGVQLEAGISFISEPQAQAAVDAANLPPEEGAALLDEYGSAQLAALKGGVLLAAAIALLSFAGTTNLPGAERDETGAEAPVGDAGDGPRPAFT